MAPHRCADWKAADHAEERPAPDPLTGLDVGRMLAGDLVEDDWPRVASAQARLSEQRPDKADELTALMERIDTAYRVKVTP